MGDSVSRHLRKRKKNPNQENSILHLGQKIEVRSIEDGFQGSWHAGVITSCGSLVREVKYDHLLCDDESDFLTESIEVSNMVDESISNFGIPNECRGRLRPFPPVREIEKEIIDYGLCVDAYYNEAWWEGVVFDTNDSSDIRKVFFPDLGDEMDVKIEDMRITLDWDEITEEWMPRGKWLFLKIIEEYEKENVVPISVKQIWYSLRERKEFGEIGEWASPVKPLWQKLVIEVIVDHLRVTLDEVLSSYEQNSSHSQAIVGPLGISLQNNDVVTPQQPNSLSIVNSDLKMLSEKFDARCTLNWQPAYAKLQIKREFSPQSIHEYYFSSHPGARLTRNVRNHLYFLGWKVDYAMYHKACRVRYTSPEGKKFYIIRSVCENFVKPLPETSTLMIEDSPSVEPDYCPEAVFKYLKCRKSNQNTKQDQDDLIINARKHLSAIGWSFSRQERKCANDDWRYNSPTKKIYISLKSACKAIAKGNESNTADSSICRSMEGLTCSGNEDGQPDSLPRKWSRKYSVPGKYRVQESGMVHKKKKNVVSRSLSSLLGCDGQGQGEDDSLMSGLNNTGKHSPIIRSSTSFLSKKRKGLGKPKRNTDSKSFTRVLRSSKRVREGDSSTSSQAPRTILSWLIENNEELDKKKVYYQRKKDLQPMKEGCVGCDGIKCVCCEAIFTLSGFEAHAGSSYYQPALNIFLEDGRSLIECQREIMRKKLDISPSFQKTHQMAKGNRNPSWNDNICSICHYGGELILCDQCPSSFHASCLNLQDIPEGDWFCQSCCCGICGESQFDVNTGHFTDKSVLCCHQCERQYHAQCVREREMVKLDVCPRENWFCSKPCEKVHWGLQQLLGKPILVGHNNLTWTLIKPRKYEEIDQNDCDITSTVENYSRLSVALDVMHECFEPVKESQTGRDLVEDVIFSRSSNLNRINFRGFYTVLLERNEELITVATLRVYGNKVAEIPLVGTRLQHRRLGMCRILMNEIEKNLMELGVNKVVLPAAGSVLDTWTSAFGFSQVSQSERSEYLGYTFFDFQDTVMCQKVLMRKPVSCLSRLRVIPAVNQEEPCPDIRRSNSELDFEGNSSVSEVFQEDQEEGSETVDQVAQVIAIEEGKRNSDSSLHPPTPMKKAESEKRVKHKGKLIFYKRKKTLEQRSSAPRARCPKVEVSCK